VPERAGAPADAPAEVILSAYADKIDALKRRAGISPPTSSTSNPTRRTSTRCCKKFSSEHWHDEDEVRYIVAGRGVFHIHPKNGPVFAIEVVAGDLIRVPRGTHHWFDLCDDRRIRAIRLFQDVTAGRRTTPESGVDTGFQPCVRAVLHSLTRADENRFLDIEGTTTPVAFVYEVLYPFAWRRIAAYLGEHWNTADVLDIRARFALEYSQGRSVAGFDIKTLAGAAGYAAWLMERDRSRRAEIPAGLHLERGLSRGRTQGRSVSGRAVCRRAVASRGDHDRDLFVGQRAGATVVVREHAGRRPDADDRRCSSTRASVRRPTRTAMSASHRRSTSIQPTFCLFRTRRRS
jgi:1,2-dihydroxy-3-keto-5-methylthiopentene dioxygenase